jgi:hypothetical protein
MLLPHSAASQCYVNAGWGLLQIPVCSGTSIPWPDMTRLFSLGSAYCYVAAIGRITLMPPSRVPGEVPPEGGSWLICMFPLNGRIDICSHRSSITSGWLNSVTPIFGHAIALKNSLFDGFTLSATGTSWRMSTHGLMIEAASLPPVGSLIFLYYC